MDDLQRLPRFSATIEMGASVLRDGWAAVFYLPCDHLGYRPIISECIADYIRLAGSRDLRWSIDEDGDPFELSKAVIDAKLARLREQTDDSVGFHLMDNPGGVSGYRTRYIGLHPSEPVVARLPTSVSLLLFTYPTAAAAGPGLVSMIRLHDSVMQRLPVRSGYMAPAFLFAPGAGEPAAFELIRRLCRRYRCLDIPYISIDCFQMDHRIKGAFWLNYFGAEAIAGLGGHETIEAALQDAQVVRRPLTEGALAVQVAAPPSGGDTNRREDVSAYAAIARLIEPLQYVPSISFPKFEPEETTDWFTRFTRED